MNQREIRGKQIAKKQDQIIKIDSTHYKVRSQTKNKKMYKVTSTETGWSCNCEDYKFRKMHCKHIYAVETSIRVHNNVKSDIVIPEVVLDSCRYCSSKRIVKMGIRHNKNYDIQMFRCKDCKRKFSYNLGFERISATPDQVTMAINLYFNGESNRKTAHSIDLMGVKVSYKTIQRWSKKYVDHMDKYLNKIIPQVGEVWCTDEVYIKIKGDRKYLFVMLDSKTCFWLAQMVAEHKGNDDVSPMFKQAKQTAGKVPSVLVSDGAANFAFAHKKEYAAKNFLDKKSEHIRHIHLDGDMNNNQIESFNSNTLRSREKVVRGIKKKDSPIFKGLQIYHNFIRPHQGLGGNDTPSDRAGIRIMGNNRWKTIIQNAAKESTKCLRENHLP